MVQKILTQLENIAFRFQYWYMKAKITREQVSRHYAFFHPRPTGEMVLKEFQKRLNRRSSTLRVLVTGCFDVLHSEHKKLLRAAKDLGGQLLVGVETDPRVHKLKGPGRPINSLTERIKNIQQLGIADEVFVLPEKFDRPEDYKKFTVKLHPDILAVSESTPFLVNKRELMASIGGQVVVVLPHNPKISTSKMLKSTS